MRPEAEYQDNALTAVSEAHSWDVHSPLEDFGRGCTSGARMVSQANCLLQSLPVDFGCLASAKHPDLTWSLILLNPPSAFLPPSILSDLTDSSQ